MIKAFRICAITIITLLLIVMIPLPCLAYNNDRHDGDIQNVLFEDGVLPGAKGYKASLDAIFSATHLTIDQSNNNGGRDYEALKSFKVRGLPKFEEINYKTEIKKHRELSHRGWLYTWEDKTTEKTWKLRKKVLLSTVNKVFGFQHFTFLRGYNDQCDSMAGLIYCTHILGDIESAENPGTDNFKSLQRLSGTNGMADDLRYFLKVLFPDQEESFYYIRLMRGMNNVEKEARRLDPLNGEQYEFYEYKQLATDLLNLLKDNVPSLLKNEQYYKKANF